MGQSENATGRTEPSGVQEKSSWKGLNWSNVYLSSQQKEAAKLFAADSDRVESCLSTLLSDGFNVSFAFNEKTDSFVCTVIGKTCSPRDVGWGMSSHAGTWFDALARALYKLFVLREDMSFAEMGEAFSTPLT